MSGLAGLLIELGHAVSGSDKVTTTETERLQRLGLRFHEQHLAEHADAADLVVFSSAIKDDNPILLTARVAENRCSVARKPSLQSCKPSAAL
jgi:UDP-N-acetylmuramate-alanine ligase